MSVVKFWNAGVFYDGKDYKGQTNKVTLTRRFSMLDTSVFGIETRVNAPAQAEWDANISGWWNADPNAVTPSAPDPHLYNAMGTVGLPLLITPSNDDLAPAFFFPAVQLSFNHFGTFAELAPFDAAFSFAQNGAAGDRVQPCRGWLGLPLQTSVAASLSGSYVQLGAPIASGQFLVMVVHLISTDATSVTFVVESDDTSGFSTPVTRLTSGALTTGQSFIDDVAGPVATDTFYRIKATRTGGTTFTAVAAFGLA